ncbi:MAG: hypothetical protein ACOCXH_05685, partial [Cyclobacteriaceae bacterium]
MKKLIFLLPIILCQCTYPESEWTLLDQNQQATIYLPPSASEPIQMAVSDMVSDVQKITGKQLEIVNDLQKLNGNTIIVANLAENADQELILKMNPDLDTLSGQWESYLVYQEESFENADNPLLMVGSDERGTMFAIYHFIEKYLQVDPFYYWTGMEPEP